MSVTLGGSNILVNTRNIHQPYKLSSSYTSSNIPDPVVLSDERLYPSVNAREKNFYKVDGNSPNYWFIDEKDYGDGKYIVKWSSQHPTGNYSPHYIFNSARTTADPNTITTAFKEPDWASGQYSTGGVYTGTNSLGGMSGDWASIEMPNKILLTKHIFIRIANDVVDPGEYMRRVPRKYAIFGCIDSSNNWEKIFEETITDAHINKPRIAINAAYVKTFQPGDRLTGDKYFNTFAFVANTIGSGNTGVRLSLSEWELYGIEELLPLEINNNGVDGYKYLTFKHDNVYNGGYKTLTTDATNLVAWYKCENYKDSTANNFHMTGFYEQRYPPTPPIGLPTGNDNASQASFNFNLNQATDMNVIDANRYQTQNTIVGFSQIINGGLYEFRSNHSGEVNGRFYRLFTDDTSNYYITFWTYSDATGLYNKTGFNNHDLTTFADGTTQRGIWVEVGVPNRIVLSKYSFRMNDTDADRNIRSLEEWVICGSNDRITWTIIHKVPRDIVAPDAVVNVPGNLVDIEYKTFTRPQPFKYIRKIIIKVDDATWVAQSSFKIYGFETVESTALDSGNMYPPVRNFTSATTVVSGQTHGNGTYNVTYSTAFGGGGYGLEPYNCFNTSVTSGGHWSDGYNSSGVYNGSQSFDGGTYKGDWLKIQLPVSIKLTRYGFSQRNGFSARAPNDFRIYGSNNNTTWDVIVNKSSISYSGASYLENVSVSGYYTYYLLVVYKLVGNDTVLNFDEWYIYGDEQIETTALHFANTISTDNGVLGTPYLLLHDTISNYTVLPASLNIYNVYDKTLAIGGSQTGITFTLWFKATGGASFARILDFSNNAIGTLGTSFIYINKNGTNTNLTFQILTNTYTTTGFNFYDGTWRHIAWSIASDDKWYIYINGVVVSNGTITRGVPNVTFIKQYIGKSDNGDGYHTNAGIEDFRIYNKSLSATEIFNLFYGGDDQKKYTVNFSQTAGTLCDILVVGGGGGGGATDAGGGGAGGLIYETGLNLKGNYTIKVGNKGLGGKGGANVGNNPGFKGHNSAIEGGEIAISKIAIGGGGGGSGYLLDLEPSIGGGGSSGGLGTSDTVRDAGNIHTTGQGFPGGLGSTTNNAGTVGGGGGGGAGGPGGNANNSGQAGAAGVGRQIDVTGSLIYYAGGGGGGHGSANVTGGLGGGGLGVGSGNAGSATFYGGGGGGGGGSWGAGGDGFMGVVILKYQNFTSVGSLSSVPLPKSTPTAPVLTATGSSESYMSFTYNTAVNNGFQTEYALNFAENTVCDILLVGGGGAGMTSVDDGGGGGAVIYNTNYLFESGTYTIGVGRGGERVTNVSLAEPGHSCYIKKTSNNEYKLRANGGIATLSRLPTRGVSGGLRVGNIGNVLNGVGTNLSNGGRGLWLVTRSDSGQNGPQVAITGVNTYYAGGGGGGGYHSGPYSHDNVVGYGGLGGGGVGGAYWQPGNGVDGLGAGGGSGGYFTSYNWGGKGGNGLIIIRFKKIVSNINYEWTYNEINANTYFLGNVGIGTIAPKYNMHVVGETYSNTYSGGSKSFMIEHPLNTNKMLYHGCIEGPRFDNIYRGKTTIVRGKCEVNIDTECNTTGGMTIGTFEKLNTNCQVFLRNNKTFDKVKGKIFGNMIKIACENTTDSIEVEWLVIGERCDRHVIDTRITNYQGRLICEHDM